MRKADSNRYPWRAEIEPRPETGRLSSVSSLIGPLVAQKTSLAGSVPKQTFPIHSTQSAPGG